MSGRKLSIRLDKLYKLSYVSYILLLLLAMWSNVKFISKNANVIKVCALLILFSQIILNFKKMNKKNLLIYVILITIFGISYYFSLDYTLLFLPFLFISFENADFDKFIKVDLVVRIILFISVLVFNQLGLTDTVFAYRDDGFLRSSLGFSHPNVIGSYLFSICCEFIYIKGKNIKLFDIIFWMIITIILGYYTNSRTSQYCIFILLGFSYLIKILSKIDKMQLNNIFKKIMIVMPIFLTIICFIFVYLYKINLSNFFGLNKLLSGRLYFWTYFIDTYNINLFGHYIVTSKNVIISNTKLILDNSFIRIILEYGLVSAIAFYYIIYNLIKKSFNKNNIYLILILFIFMIGGLSENILYQYQFNIFLLYAFNKFSN